MNEFDLKDVERCWKGSSFWRYTTDQFIEEDRKPTGPCHVLIMDAITRILEKS